MSDYTLLRHPFISMYHFFGTPMLAFIFSGFIIVTLAIAFSYRVLSKNRFLVALGIYIMWSTLLFYTLFADLGYLPTANVLLVRVNTYIPMLGILIRLFVNPIKAVERLEESIKI